MALGDGSVVRGAIGALLDVLHRFAAPTGTRGSVLLMTGGLIILGFLFLAFLFRSAIVGDLAPVANARASVPRVVPPSETPRKPPPDARPRPFDEARALAQREPGTLDEAFDRMRQEGLDARILLTTAGSKRVRAYACLSCATDHAIVGCEHERGLLAGSFEALSGELAKVEEVACRAGGAPHCEFEVRHAPLPEVEA